MDPDKNTKKIDSAGVPEEKKKELKEELKLLLKENGTINDQENDDYLLQYLASCKYNVQKAYNRMSSFYTHVLDNPGLFTTKEQEDLRRLVEEGAAIILPTDPQDGRLIFILKVGNLSSYNMEFIDIAHVFALWMEYAFTEMDVKPEEVGVHAIIDVSGMAWNLYSWGTPNNITTAINIIRDYPIRYYNFHLVNSSYLISMAMNLILPFISERIQQIIHFHYENLDSLHEHVNPDVLPTEYGGYREYNYEECFEKLLEKGDLLEDIFKKRYTYFSPSQEQD